jgi:hypothetical protein
MDVTAELINPLSVINTMLFKAVMDKHQIDGVAYTGIDKVVIGIPFKPIISDDMSDSEKVIVMIEAMKYGCATVKYIENSLEGVFGIFGKPLKKIPMLKRYHLRSDAGGKKLIAVILAGKNPNGVPVLNFEFNPSKMDEGDWGEFEVALSLLLFNHYEELYAQGVVSHVEFFIDLDQYSPNDLVLLSLARRSHTEFKTTAYCGKRASRLVGTIYNKADQMKISGNLIRVEIRLNGRDMQFQTLVEKNVRNPLKEFVVVPSDALDKISNEWNLPCLGDKIKNFGVHESIKNKHARKAILERLNELAAPWWNPEKLWGNYRTMLAEFRPDFIGGNTNGLAPLSGTA